MPTEAAGVDTGGDPLAPGIFSRVSHRSPWLSRALSSASRSVILPDLTPPLLPQSHRNLPAPASYTNQRPFSMDITPNLIS